MANFAVTFRDKQLGRKYVKIMEGHATAHRKALVAAADSAKDEALEKSREQISEAGNFGSRWTKGLHGAVVKDGDNLRLAFNHDIPYFLVHQDGATIRGKPLLWIPMSFTGVTVRARDYPRPLVRVDRKNGGAPLLFDIVLKKPIYSGHRQVKIPKRFRVVEIIRDVAKTIPRRFEIALKGHI